jgi:hypothetical protein
MRASVLPQFWSACQTPGGIASSPGVASVKKNCAMPMAPPVRPAVVERDPEIPGRDEVAIGLLLVHAPALDPPGPDHDLVPVHDRLGPEPIACVEKGDERATMIGHGSKALEDDVFEALAEFAAVSVHRWPVARGDLHELVGRQPWSVAAFPHR